MSDPRSGAETPRPPPGRRLAAIVYDGILLCGVVLVAGLPLPLIPEQFRHHWWIELFTQAYLLLVVLLFFTWFWVHGGQTLGMRAARIAVVGPRAHIPSVVRAVVRAVLQAVGLLLGGVTLAWVIIDRERRTLHDRLANTFPIRAGGTP